MGIFTLIAVIIVTSVAYVCYQQWLQHHKRLMIHRERITALERGVALPPADVELQRKNWNVQRLLLLGGLFWMSLGIGAFVFLQAMHIYHPQSRDFMGTQWIAVPIVLIGLSHIIVFAVERSRDR